jgi:hypothetical protein
MWERLWETTVLMVAEMVESKADKMAEMLAAL